MAFQYSAFQPSAFQSDNPFGPVVKAGSTVFITEQVRFTAAVESSRFVAFVEQDRFLEVDNGNVSTTG